MRPLRDELLADHAACPRRVPPARRSCGPPSFEHRTDGSSAFGMLQEVREWRPRKSRRRSHATLLDDLIKGRERSCRWPAQVCWVRVGIGRLDELRPVVLLEQAADNAGRGEVDAHLVGADHRPHFKLGRPLGAVGDPLVVVPQRSSVKMSRSCHAASVSRRRSRWCFVSAIHGRLTTASLLRLFVKIFFPVAIFEDPRHAILQTKSPVRTPQGLRCDPGQRTS